MRILLTGATGLLGGELLRLLLAEGHEARCLIRSASPNASRLVGERAEILRGDAAREEDLYRALRDTDAMLHVAGIEYAPPVVRAASRAGVERILIVGSTSAHSAYAFRSGPKVRMEELVRGSGLAWTILRPSMIYGSERDRNVHRLLRFLDRSPVFPVFGPGTNLWQPVYYEDCARGVFEALQRPASVHRSYDLPGAEPLTYLDLVKIAAAALGRSPSIVRLPIEPIRWALAAAERLRLPLPVDSGQVTRLREDKAYPYEQARHDLDYAPRPFREGIVLEVARLRKLGMVRS
ncbi:MAG: NAD(P)H-binding protein [Actinomycetota bacterium]|nr:NAD(P)H-binding protein [Rubrobacteraceae bacterium]MDQ3183778.1 NAD(P)H-binding protein [Actinomycetota bacterium]